MYDAAGDLFGSYIWDINTSALSGTLGGNFVNNSKETNRKGHLDYLHTIKTVPGSTLVLSGGEDGQVGIWDGNQETLVEMIQDPSTIKKMNTQFKSNGTLIPSSQHASARWVSSIAVDEQGNWAAFGGGIEHETATRMSSTRGGVRDTAGNGFVSILNLHARMMSSCYSTRESINSVAYYGNEGTILSVGNEGVVSSWKKNVDVGKIGRTWLSAPSYYSIAVCPNGKTVALGGVDSSLDCLTSGLAAKSFSLNFGY